MKECLKDIFKENVLNYEKTDLIYGLKNWKLIFKTKIKRLERNLNTKMHSQLYLQWLAQLNVCRHVVFINHMLCRASG